MSALSSDPNPADPMDPTRSPAGPVIILVQPQLAENIGMTARAMANFGLSELRLVAPKNGWPKKGVREAASGATHILDGAVVYATLGEAILIAWNGSTETARAVAFAMPFLRQAKRIRVISVEGGTVPGPTAEELARALACEGISADFRAHSAGRRTPGEVYLAEAEAFGCDLLIKGAYTQSRLRQMIFGGPTSHLLAHAAIPMLMAH